MSIQTIDSWHHMIKDLVDDYDLYQDISKNGYPVRLEIKPFKNFWILRVVEDLSIGAGDLYYTAPLKKLNQAREWTANQLKSWKRVSKTTDHRWVFLDLASAEKFKTLFNLRWHG
jgi:regulator of sigma D